MSSTNLYAIAESNPLVGSSSNNTEGEVNNSLQIHVLLRSPPEILPILVCLALASWRKFMFVSTIASNSSKGLSMRMRAVNNRCSWTCEVVEHNVVLLHEADPALEALGEE